MKSLTYKKQVGLMLTVIPEIAKEDCFALHGGTAINLFVRNMPRLSVDIDLTYIPVEDRTTSINNINSALVSIKLRLEKLMPETLILHKQDEAKLIITARDVIVKLEVNTIKRGVLSQPETRTLCAKAEQEFDVACSINVVSLSELYGGKICAALDRQHPRDLFDIKFLLESEGYTDAIKTGCYFALLGSSKPIHELLFPNLHDQQKAFEYQFTGMSFEHFTYTDYENVRSKLLAVIHNNITDYDKSFLLNFNKLTPDWSLYPFENLPDFVWKLQNLQKLKTINPQKYQEQIDLLQLKFS